MSAENESIDKAKLISSLQQIHALAEECLAGLGESAGPSRATKKPPTQRRAVGHLSIDFDKPMRPFIKRYTKGLSGSKKFVLVLSRLVKGDLKKEVPVEEVQRHWSKMKAKSLLGLDFNNFYPTNAKENDWVESRKREFYSLRPSWKEIFKTTNA